MTNISSQVIKYAQETQAKYGVPASVTIAQYGVESGWGTSNLATSANNYFGVTGSNVKTGASVTANGRTFAKYDSMQESFDDHGRLLSTTKYTALHGNTTDPYAYVDAIAETYAPSSDGNSGYATLVKQVIKDNNLTQYDLKTVGNVTFGGGTSDYDNLGGGVLGTPSGLYMSDETIAQVDAAYTGFFESDFWLEILGKIVKFLVVVLVGVMAALFFFSAFNLENPVRSMKKKAVKKVVKEAGGEDG